MAYFTVRELRDRFDELDPGDYTDAEIEEARDLAEQTIEHACDVAFEPRTVTDRVVSGDGTDVLWLPHNRIRSVTAATAPDTTIDVADSTVQGSRAYLATGTWPTGYGNVTITYTHGHDEPPLRVKRAAMLLARTWLIDGPISARATQLSVDGGGTVNLATPGVFGAVTGIPEVDATIHQYREPSLVG